MIDFELNEYGPESFYSLGNDGGPIDKGRNIMKLPKQLVVIMVIGLTICAHSQVLAMGLGRNIIVELRGEALGEPRDIDGVENVCFDVGLYVPGTDKRVGDGADCLDLNSINPIDAGNFAITNTTFFNFHGGQLVSQSRTSIREVVEPAAGGATHITGDVDSVDNILGGTRRFHNASGDVRLSGAVDMSQFGAGIISFTCIFCIPSAPMGQI